MWAEQKSDLSRGVKEETHPAVLTQEIFSLALSSGSARRCAEKLRFSDGPLNDWAATPPL